MTKTTRPTMQPQARPRQRRSLHGWEERGGEGRRGEEKRGEHAHTHMLTGAGCSWPNGGGRTAPVKCGVWAKHRRVGL